MYPRSRPRCPLWRNQNLGSFPRNAPKIQDPQLSHHDGARIGPPYEKCTQSPYCGGSRSQSPGFFPRLYPRSRIPRSSTTKKGPAPFQDLGPQSPFDDEAMSPRPCVLPSNASSIHAPCSTVLEPRSQGIQIKHLTFRLRVSNCVMGPGSQGVVPFQVMGPEIHPQTYEMGFSGTSTPNLLPLCSDFWLPFLF